jgi:two-component system, LytTR family, response regulator
MKQVRTLIVDDETAAQKTLSGMLSVFCPQVNVIGRASSVSEAVPLVERLNPDLIFLDIQMSPYESGFDLIGRTKHLSYGVIFVTAYSQYAIKAINTVQPWAYLVKPFSSDDLMEAVRNACKKMVEKQEQPLENDDPLSSLIISDARKGKIIIRCSDILYCKNDQSVVEIYYLKDGTQVECAYTYKSLRQIQEELSPRQFCRIHHSCIVNLAFVRQLEKKGRAGVVHLNDGLILPVSVKKIGEFGVQLARFLG